MKAKWLKWSTELQAIAQAGITYSKDPYDIERFERIREMAAEMMDNHTDLPMEKVKDLFCGDEGYQTPKVDVRGVVVKDNQILLVKETFDGKWSLPGGWADVNLSAGENVVKEMKEEAGLEVEVSALIAVLDRNKHNRPISAHTIYKMFIKCEVIGGDFVANTETSESAYFDIDALPELSTGRVTKAQLEMCLEAAKNMMEWKVIYD